ncbi:hypothetical protein H8A99_20875 [Bradyrhizobium sp. Arg68]|uniref:hypothetical protein n=1 Tax=Bradyrhizobium ivorense TaxID=2511166 RepID=UPI001E34498B|nr:hypothetical protein [Bradyrhizobium ivorense]MCC8938861.1 hypothetical protein [Bradyrhizobium ivorense]
MRRSPIPPRLFVIFAKSAHEAVIFRRGPATWYHVIRWNTRDDTFHSGAWFKGRIYPEKCDLSPDGELLLYFVHQANRVRTDYTDAWTAISRNPWLTAIGLWPQGTTYGGGGRFTDNRSAIIRGCRNAHPDHPGAGISITLGDVPLHASSKEVEGSEWSGRDQDGRLVFTLNGLLMHRSDAGDDICLADFNGYTPDPQAAPPSADRPLSPLRPSIKRRRKKQGP